MAILLPEATQTSTESLTPRQIVAELDKYVVGQAAAKALAHNTDLDARAIAEKAMAIAGEICIYTNAKIVVEEL